MIDISIIVPTLNRARSLFDTLKSIAAIVEPVDTVEVIIVDNGSTDETAAVSRAIKEKYPRHEWYYFYEPMPGLLSGRHLGAKQARGNILAYLDDDVVLAPSWLEALREGFSDPSSALLGGPSLPRYECEPPMWLEGLWVESEYGRFLDQLSLFDGGSSFRTSDPRHVWGLNFAVRKSVFQACGGFHPDIVPKALQHYQGDGETGLARKIKNAGLRSLYHPGAAVEHLIPRSRLTPESFERRAFYNGVCESYALIRRERRVEPDESKTWKARLRPIRNKLQREFLLRRGDSESVRTLEAHARQSGFRFHQNEVRNDPKLLDWVLKPDYLDYSLPEGWQDYLIQPRAN